MENGLFLLDLPTKIVIFHSYVKLSEGKWEMVNQRWGNYGPLEFAWYWFVPLWEVRFKRI